MSESQTTKSSEITFGILLIFGLLILAVPIKHYHENLKKNSTNNHDFLSKIFKIFGNNNSTNLENNTKIYQRASLDEENNTVIFINNITKFGTTKFSNLTDDEFSKKYLQHKLLFHNALRYELATNRIGSIKSIDEFKNRGYPMEIDWRTENAVTEIRDQGRCGSCYAHSVIGMIESALAIKEKLAKPIKFSIQQMLDCDESDNYGCLGGDHCNLIKWLELKKFYILPEEIYEKYTKFNTSFKCELNKINLDNSIKTVRVVNHKCINFINHEFELLITVATKGPVAASVNGLLWKNYQGGVIKFHCNGSQNHVIEIVGYNLNSDEPYYLVRNSWGHDFGLDGYAKVSFGQNICNIASEVSMVDIA